LRESSPAVLRYPCWPPFFAYLNKVSSNVADPWHFDTDPDPRIHASDPDSAIFVIDLQDANKKLI
jgi:hypothetical protein